MVGLGEYELSKLRDSRIYYMRNPPRFIPIAIAIIIVVIAGVLAWSCTTVKAEEIENRGIIVDSGAMTLVADASSPITVLYVSEGDIVEQGDILYMQDTSVIDAERNSYASTKERLSQRISMIDTFISSLESSSRNPFSNEGSQKEFYTLRASYDNEISQLKAQNDRDPIRLKYLADLYSQRAECERAIASAATYADAVSKCSIRIGFIDRMLSALEAGSLENPFLDNPGEREFRSIFDGYMSEYNSAPSGEQKESVRRAYTINLYSQRSETENEMKSAQGYADSALGFSERIDSIDRMVDALENSSARNPFGRHEREFYNLFEAYSAEVDALDLSDRRNAVKLRYISNLQSDRNTCMQQMESAEVSMGICDANIAKHTKLAPCTGTIHFYSKLDRGSFLQSGTAFGSIDSGSGRIVEMYVSAHDRSRMEEGQECRFTVDGLSQTEFGSIVGKIESISSDATVTESGSIFMVTVSFQDSELVDKKDKAVTVKIGMTVRVWTVYEESTYMDYFLERIGFR